MPRHRLVRCALVLYVICGAVVMVAQAPESSGTKAPPARESQRTVRLVGDIIVESKREPLSNEDVRQIQTALAPSVVWWINARYSGIGAVACVQPDQATREIRRGRCVYLHKRTTEVSRPGDWERDFDCEYVQIAVGVNDAASQPPIEVYRSSPSTPSNDDLIAIAALVRRRAVSATTARLESEVQPWPLDTIDWGKGEEVLVTLRVPIALEATTVKPTQWVLLRRQADGWEVIRML